MKSSIKACLVLIVFAWTAPVDAQVIRYYHTDITGSVVAVTDENANVIERRVYEPYGLPQTPIPDGPGYTGHDMDGDTGLVYMQQRYYDPLVGRFLSVDPVGVNEATGTNFNRYWYANDNPYKYVDPDGEFGLIGFAVCFGMDVGAQMIQGKSIGEVDYKSALISGAVGMVTGGVGGSLARNAAHGVIKASTATAQTTAVGGVTSMAGEVGNALANGETPDPVDVALAGVFGAVGSRAGARIANAPTAELQAMGSAGGLAANVAGTTLTSFTGKGAETVISGTQKAAIVTTDIVTNAAQKRFSDRDEL